MMNQLSYLTKKQTLYGFYFLYFQAVLLPLILALVNTLLPTPFSDAILNFIYFSISFLCAILLFRNYLYGQIAALRSSPMRVLRWALSGYVLYYAAFICVGILIQHIYPEFSNANDNNIGVLVQDNFILTTVGTVLLVPPVEELLYRTLLFGTIHKRSRIAAYIINIIIFGGIHIVEYIGSSDPISLLLSFLQYAPASICLCWAYERTDSIFAPMLMHMAINLLGIFLVR